ncbi:MAG: DUF1330 domain-containing protein [Myxococcales bacterium FL481]|nr:MAG: DUF1330 domain-containing protein [Myxococcales bacterium FL481]
MATRDDADQPGSAPRHVTLVGLHVHDDALYDEYRAGMSPLLEQYGGQFEYDVVVGQLLKSKDGALINRVFTISFPDAKTKARFFSDPRYLAVREEFFDAAVSLVVTMGVLHRE